MINLVVLYLQYDTNKYKDSFVKLQEYLSVLDCNKQIVVIDNKFESDYFRWNKGIVEINGDNSGWEFSGWDKGLSYLKETNIQYDAILFVNDSFLNPGAGGSPDLIINNEQLNSCIENNAFISNTVSQAHVKLELNGIDVSTWSRSHCFILSKPMIDYLGHIQSYDINFLNKCIKEEKHHRYFKTDAPLNESLKTLIINWLSGYWHSAFVIEENWELFRMKTLAFFNEITLSARIKEMQNNINYKIDNSDLIMFDVFDTCLFRKVKEPWEIFYYMGCDFNGNRQEAEKKALELDINCDLVDIYNTGNLSNDKFKQEIELEKALCYQNPEVFEMYKYAASKNKEIIFLSDMYLPSFVIKEMLQKCGYSNPKVFVSNEMKYRKDNGESYGFIKGLFDNINPKRILMIGDNECSDYNMANKSGLNTYHYKKQQTEEDFWFKLGYNSVGCIIYAYINWLKEQFKDKGIEKVYFFSREGDLFKKVYDSIKTDKDPESVLLHLSRKSLNIPLLYDIPKEEFFNNIEHKHLLWHLANLSSTSTKNFCDYFGVDYTKLFDRLYANELIYDNLGDLSFPLRESIQTEILKVIYLDIQDKAKEELSKAYKYINGKMGCNTIDNRKIAIVDLGWGGSIQESFIKFIHKYHNKTTNIECFLLSTESRIKDREDKYSFNSFLDLNCPTFVHNVYMIESLFNAPYGSCLGYTKEGEPIFDNEDCSYCENIHKGVIEFSKDAPKMTIGDSKRLGLYNLSKIMHSPTVQESKQIGKLKLYSSGTNGFFEHIANPDLSFLNEQYKQARNKTMFYINVKRLLHEWQV